MIGNFFLRNNIEENVAQHLIFGCSVKKDQSDTSFGRCFYLKNGHEKCQNMAKFSYKNRNIFNFSLKLNNF
jgi:hypothetical protein